MAEARDAPRPAWPKARDVFTDPIHLLAFGFGSGLSRVAPGTFGSAASLVVYFALLGQHPYLIVALAVIFTLLGFEICGRSAAKLGVHDHPGIVWDEWAGMFVALAFIPVAIVSAVDLLWVLAAFLLFRFFDIVKPWPARYFDRERHDGVGIVMDDVVAGLYAGLVLTLAAVLIVPSAIGG
ncbi:MAG: phosphatidylglycerophosphatase A [Thioalkalivibrionaceae bacterium]